MTMSDDDSDDDLFLDQGLSTKRQKQQQDVESQRRTKLNLFLTEALEDDAQTRLRQDRLTKILADNTNTLEQAEEALAEANALHFKQKQEKETDTASGWRQLESYHPHASSFGIQKDESRRRSVQETAGSDLLGTRRNVVKQVKRNQLWTPKEVIQKMDRTEDHRALISKYLQQPSDLLIHILQKKTLNKKLVDFPQPLLDWLWRCSIDYESDYRDGAYVTLKEYLMENVTEKISLKTMMEQWTEWFQAKEDDEKEQIREESLRDVQYWLELWGVILERDICCSSSGGDGDSHVEADMVADLIVVLSTMSLDEQFHGGRGYRPDCQVAGSWRKTVSTLFSSLHSGLPNDQWKLWVSKTCTTLLEIQIEPPTQNAEDSDDMNNFLSRSLLVRNFALGVSTDFGLRLGMMTLAQFLDVQDWNDELLKVEQECLVCLSKEQQTKDLVCLSCAMLIIDRKGDEIKVNGPRVLACVKTMNDCALKSIQLVGDIDIINWLEFFEQQVLNLIKVMMRFSTQAHHRRAEVVLSSLRSYLKTCINEKKLSSRGMVQSSLDKYYSNEQEE